MKISPELLAAYADGELDSETARAVEAEIAGNPRLQDDLAAHRALRDMLAARFAPVAEQPVPERLRQAVMGEAETSKVVDFAAHANKRGTSVWPAQWRRIVGPALAASLVLGLIGFGLRSPGSDYAHGDLASALDSQLIATQGADAPVRMLLSFRDEQGQYCRAFAAEGRSGIACRDDRGWRLRKILDGAMGDRAEYRQAGSADMAIMAAAQDMATGEALDAAQEKEASRGGWNPQGR